MLSLPWSSTSISPVQLLQRRPVKIKVPAPAATNSFSGYSRGAHLSQCGIYVVPVLHIYFEETNSNAPIPAVQVAKPRKSKDLSMLVFVTKSRPSHTKINYYQNVSHQIPSHQYLNYQQYL